MPEAASAYPLAWPAGVLRTPETNRRKASFRGASVNRSVKELQRQVKLLQGSGLVISTNIKLRLDGLPYSNPPRITDHGAAIYFQRKGVPYAFPCDRWSSIEDNLWAIATHLEAMRGMERWGVGSVEQQFMGYKALTATAGGGEDPWAVLDLPPTSNSTDIHQAHRKLALTAHPDRGGSEEQMARINIARDAALAALVAQR